MILDQICAEQVARIKKVEAEMRQACILDRNMRYIDNIEGWVEPGSDTVALETLLTLSSE